MNRIPLLNFGLILWWVFIVCLSLSGLSQVDPPSSETILILLVSISSMFFGGLLSFFIPLRKFSTQTQFLNDRIIRNILFLLLIIFLYPLFNAILFVLNEGVDGFRTLAFTIDKETGESLVFGSLKVQFIINSFLKPFVYFILFYVIYNYFFLNNRNNLIFAIAVLFVLSLSTLGRFFIYHLIVILIASFIVKTNLFKGKAIKSELVKISKVFFILVLLIVTISIFRDIDSLLDSILDYHVLGVKIFSQYIDDKSSVFYNDDFTITSLGLLERLFVIVSNKFGADFISSVDQSERILSIFRYVGHEKLYNAYSTWFFSLYRDGGVVYCMIFCFLYSFVLSYFERTFYYFKDARSFLCMLSLFFIGFFSVFTSMIQGPYILLPLMSFILSQPKNL